MKSSSHDQLNINPRGVRASKSFLNLEKDTTISSRYKVQRLLGRGSSGSVYLCSDSMLSDLQVAVKLFPRTDSDNQQLVRRIYREMLTCNNVNHPNVTKFYECIYSDEYIGYSMEYVDGTSIATLIDKKTVLPLKTTLHLFRQVLLGLHAIHSIGVVHRDLKPSNILCTSEGQIKISDFGVATHRIKTNKSSDVLPNFDLLDEDRPTDTYTYTEDGCFVGTPRYLSPEYVESGSTDNRSDLYACGIILYELITHNYPYIYGSLIELLRSKVEDSPIPPNSIIENCPLGLSNFIMTFIATKPEERYQSALEALDALNNLETILSQFNSDVYNFDDESEILGGTRSFNHGSHAYPLGDEKVEYKIEYVGRIDLPLFLLITAICFSGSILAFLAANNAASEEIGRKIYSFMVVFISDALVHLQKISDLR